MLAASGCTVGTAEAAVWAGGCSTWRSMAAGIAWSSGISSADSSSLGSSVSSRGRSVACSAAACRRVRHWRSASRALAHRVVSQSSHSQRARRTSDSSN